MSAETDPLPPVPQQTPPLQKFEERSPFAKNWMQWFVQLREKVNVINESLANISQIVQNGFAVLTSTGTWQARTITGTPDRIEVTNGDGVAGNPVINFLNEGVVDAIASALVAGSNVTINYNDAAGTITIASSGGGGAAFDPSTSFYRYEDFVQGVVASTNTGTSFVTTEGVPVSYNSGSGAGTSFTASGSGTPGIASVSTGTTTGGFVRLAVIPPRLRLGGGAIEIRFRVRIPTLSDATQTFSIVCGLNQNITGSTGEFIHIQYQYDVNGGNWQFISSAASTTTTANASVGPVANTWTTLGLLVNSAGTQLDLEVDGVNAATITTNIPTGQDFAVQVRPTKTAGTTARTIEVDYVMIEQAFSSAR